MSPLPNLFVLASAAALSAGSVKDVPQPTTGRAWTVDDILTAPEVTDLVLGADKEMAFYVVKAVDPDRLEDRSTLFRYERATHTATPLLSARDIQQISLKPGTATLTALLDLGEGRQLYSIDMDGKPTPLVVGKEPFLFGNVCGGYPDYWYAAPERVGVLSYSWSPDGHYLWYALAKPKAPASVQINEEVLDNSWRPCPAGDGNVEFRLRGADGLDHLVATSPIADRIATGHNGGIRWLAGSLHYQQEEHARRSPLVLKSFNVDLATFQSTEIDHSPDTGLGVAIGPWGGIVGTVGFGTQRHLIEQISDHNNKDYGPAAVTVGDPRSAGNWLSTDGTVALVGTRYFDRPRYGLEWVSRREHHSIGGDDSLTKCAFQSDLSFGLCIREGMVKAPELVEVEPAIGAITHAFFISPRHQEIAPLNVVSRSWVSHLGDETTGFVIYPRDYVPGRRYPTIIVTHGSDADQRYAAPGFQWNYPVQVFAERGYVVLALNDPSSSRSEKLSQANAAWGGVTGLMPPAEVRQQVWLNGVVCIEDAVGDLVNEGLADPARLGIAGFSRGSQMTQVVMTQSHLFRAASSGDGDMLDPSSWWDGRTDYVPVFGGSPYDPAISAYREISPQLRASHVTGAILQQMAIPRQGALFLQRQLVAAKVPAEFVLYPGENPSSYESHMFHIPANRRRAMFENLAWFDVWLKGTVPSDAPSPERAAVWLDMSKHLAAQHLALP